VRPRQLVGLPGRHEAESLAVGDPGEERHQLACGGVGMVKVLEDEGHRARLAEPSERAEDALEDAGLAPLGRCRRRAFRKDAQVAGARTEPGHQPDHVLRAGRQDRGELPVRELQQDRLDRPDQRRVRPVRAGRSRAAAEDEERLRQRGEADRRLVEEARHADPAGARHEDGSRPPVGSHFERGRKAGEGPLTPDEPRAREPRGHDRILDTGFRHPTPIPQRASVRVRIGHIRRAGVR
jgi:hypothetical protein